MRSSFLALLVALLISCYDPITAPPVEPSYPTSYVGDLEADCSRACVTLRRIGCPEGQGAISGETCERRCAIAMELRSMPLECWGAATDVVSARSCGSIRCTR